MKINFIFIVLICALFFGCKHDTTKCPPCPECPKAHVEVGSTMTNKFLTLSDVHIDDTLKVNYYGSTYHGVTTDKLWQRTKVKIEAVAKAESPKFMVYLGDLPGYVDQTRPDNAHEMLQNLRNLNVDIPILYLPGNNDSLKGDYHSFSTDSVHINTVLTYKTALKDSLPIINPITASTTVANIDFKKEFGYYSADIIVEKDTLKVIALNTVIFSDSPSHPYTADDGFLQPEATKDQMTWFEGKLKDLKASDRVLIMMHIPIGADSYGGSQLWKDDLMLADHKQTLYNGFLDLIAKYQSNIVGLLNGHTHTDGLRRIYKSEDKSTMTSFSISTPGIAVNHSNNPAFKTFTYDATNFDLIDFETYFASPTKYVSHSSSNNKLNNSDFEFLEDSSYTFKQMYKVNNPKETIFSTLARQEEDSLVFYVNSTLGAKSNQDVKLIHPEAVNVLKKK